MASGYLSRGHTTLLSPSPAARKKVRRWTNSRQGRQSLSLSLSLSAPIRFGLACFARPTGIYSSGIPRIPRELMSLFKAVEVLSQIGNLHVAKWFGDYRHGFVLPRARTEILQLLS